MKWFSKLFCITVTFTVLLSLSSCSSGNKDTVEKIKSNGYISVATNAEFEPFEFRKNNDIVGIDIDVSKEIADQLGVELVVNDMSFDAIIFEIKEGKSDFSAAAISYDKDKENSVDFSDPYFKTSQSIIVSKNSDISCEDDLCNKSVGVHLGTTGDNFCTKNGKMQVIRYNKSMDAVSDLINGQINAVVVDDFTADKLVEKNTSYVKKINKPITEEEYRIVVKKGNTELLKVINDTISNLKETGKLDSIIKKYVHEEIENEGIVEKPENNNDNSFWGNIKLSLIKDDRYKYIVNGLFETLKITVCAAIIGAVIGILIALIKVLSKENKKFKPLEFIANIYLTVIRGTPTVIQLFIMYYVILSSYNISKSFVAILAFGINSGAYVAEIVRAGILSVDKGQMEAGRSLGLNFKTTFHKIIFPQALKNILPALVNEMITLIKETSVAGFIGVVDLSKAGDIIRSQTYEAVVPFLTVALIYLVLVVGFTAVLSKFERRLRRSDTR